MSQGPEWALAGKLGMSDLRKVAVKALKDGRNISQTLRSHFGFRENTPDIIEAAYDLQAGTYVQFAKENPQYVRAYASQLAEHLQPHLSEGDVLMDVGAGELTNLSHLIAALKVRLSLIYACDISERRLDIGRTYAIRHMGEAFDRLRIFRSELG